MKFGDVGGGNVPELESAEGRFDMQSEISLLFLDRPWLLVRPRVFLNVPIRKSSKGRSISVCSVCRGRSLLLLRRVDPIPHLTE
jgi:hypothetical protein